MGILELKLNENEGGDMSYCVTYFNFALFPLKGWGGFATHNSLKYKLKSYYTNKNKIYF